MVRSHQTRTRIYVLSLQRTAAERFVRYIDDGHADKNPVVYAPARLIAAPTRLAQDVRVETS